MQLISMISFRWLHKMNFYDFANYDNKKTTDRGRSKGTSPQKWKCLNPPTPMSPGK